MRARATDTGHAQNNYLLKPLTDERGVYRYKLVDGAGCAADTGRDGRGL